MDEYIYTTSIFWNILDSISNTAFFVMPFLLLISAILWYLKQKTKLSIIAIIGSLLATTSRIVHIVIGSVSTVALGYRHPAIEENPLIWFLFTHGLNYGVALFLISLALYFYKLKNA